MNESFCPTCERAYLYPAGEMECIPGECRAPLHVRVAVALGWTKVRLEPRGGHNFTPMWFGRRPPDDHVYADVRGVGAASYGVPNFDTSWCQTGSLIEKYGISLSYFKCVPECCPEPVTWTAEYGPSQEERNQAAEGTTPLVAVCNLILALGETGKL